MKRLIRGLILVLAIVFAPLIYLRATTPILNADQAAPADTVLVFGALVRNGQVSALHAERLDTAAELSQRGVINTITVSNAARAAEVMRDYLVQSGIPDGAIEVDPNAPATPDTCATEADRAAPRKVILLSQSFHLPRISLQCGNLGVKGQLVAATPGPRMTQTNLIQTLWIRIRRHTREALLIWTELLGLYRVLS